MLLKEWFYTFNKEVMTVTKIYHSLRIGGNNIVFFRLFLWSNNEFVVLTSTLPYWSTILNIRQFSIYQMLIEKNCVKKNAKKVYPDKEFDSVFVLHVHSNAKNLLSIFIYYTLLTIELPGFARRSLDRGMVLRGVLHYII